jgi:hypothetical protein
MTQDEIIKVADASGLSYYGMGKDRDRFLHHVETFANLVAAAEREAIAQMFEALPELVRIAQNDWGGCIICGLNPRTEAKAIRARGNT